MPSPPPSARLLLEPTQLDPRTGYKGSPRASLPSWLAPSGTGSFAWSPDSDQSRLQRSNLELPHLHQAQQTMLTDARRFNVAACGRQMGKTTLGTYLVADAAQHNRACAWFGPTYKFTEEVWRSLRTLLEPITVTKSEQQHRLDVHGGGSVECWSLEDPNAGRGRRYALAVVDEAALVRDLGTVWQASIRPTLSVQRGSAWFLSTPRGLDFFHELFRLGQDTLQSEWQSWQMPSSASPYIAPEEIEAARHQLPERVFHQEYLAEFLQLDGAGVFRGVHAVSRLEPRGPERGHVYVLGIDWAAGGGDYTVFSVIDATLAQQVFVDRMSTLDFETQLRRLQRVAQVYHPQSVIAEANSMGMPLVQRLQSGYQLVDGTRVPALPVIAWTATNATKAQVVQDLAIAIEDGAITLLDDPLQMGELLAYEVQRLPSGMLRYAAPSNQHDDLVTALMLAWQGAKTPLETRRTGYAFASRR
jgi:hypothetical protein